jgi:hypothetical protein
MLRKSRWVLLGGFMVAMACQAAVAQDYFVAPDGNDGNPGTLEKPKKSPVKVAAMLKPGDTLYFRKGTYRCRTNRIIGLAPSRDGEEGKPITFKNYKNEHVKIDVAGADWGFTTNGYGYIVIDGFEITGGNKNNNMKISGHHGGGGKGKHRNVTIRNCEVHGSGRENVFIRHHANVVVENCHLHHSRRSHGLYMSVGCHNSIVRNVTSEHNHGNSGMQINAAGAGTKNVLVERCVLRHNAQGFSLIAAVNCKFRNNVVYNNGFIGPRKSGKREMIIWTYGKPQVVSEGCVIENNTFVSTIPRGYKINNLVRSTAGTKDCIFRNNIFVVRGKPVFNLETCDGFVFENNCLWTKGSQVKQGGSLVDFCKSKGLKESGTIVKDPMLVDVANCDLRLKDGSPCIDAGVKTEAGAKVAGKAPDLGAYEKGAEVQIGCKLPWKQPAGEGGAEGK